MTVSDGLSSKQRQALPIFATQSNVEKACAEAGISKQTYYQWMKQPSFREELRNIRYAIGSESIELLKIESRRAAVTLVQLLGEENPPAVRRAAANDVLNYVLKFRDEESYSGFGYDLFG